MEYAWRSHFPSKELCGRFTRTACGSEKCIPLDKETDASVAVCDVHHCRASLAYTVHPVGSQGRDAKLDTKKKHTGSSQTGAFLVQNYGLSDLVSSAQTYPEDDHNASCQNIFSAVTSLRYIHHTQTTNPSTLSHLEVSQLRRPCLTLLVVCGYHSLRQSTACMLSSYQGVCPREAKLCNRRSHVLTVNSLLTETPSGIPRPRSLYFPISKELGRRSYRTACGCAKYSFSLNTRLLRSLVVYWPYIWLAI